MRSVAICIGKPAAKCNVIHRTIGLKLEGWFESVLTFLPWRSLCLMQVKQLRRQICQRIPERTSSTTDHCALLTNSTRVHFLFAIAIQCTFASFRFACVYHYYSIRKSRVSNIERDKKRVSWITSFNSLNIALSSTIFICIEITCIQANTVLKSEGIKQM